MLHLVTGGSGFVGSNIARMLIERGEQVRVLDIWKSDELPDAVEFAKADITDSQAVDTAMRGVDYVHHVAALVPLAKAGSRYWTVNVDGTRNALDGARKAGVKFFSHMSSSAVFGSPDVMPIDDSTSRRPVEIYGEAKKAGEDLVFKAAEEGMKVAVIRPRTIIGTRRLGIFQILFDWIKDGANIFIIGKGDQRFQFVHADDLCQGSIQCCLLERPGTYNIGTDRFATLREDLEFLCAHAGTGSRVRSLPVKPAIWSLSVLDRLGLSPLSPWHYLTYHKAYYFDSEPVFRDLEYRPKYGNREMITDSYDWFLQNYESQNVRDDASSHTSPVKQGILNLLKRVS